MFLSDRKIWIMMSIGMTSVLKALQLGKKKLINFMGQCLGLWNQSLCTVSV